MKSWLILGLVIYLGRNQSVHQQSVVVLSALKFTWSSQALAYRASSKTEWNGQVRLSKVLIESGQSGFTSLWGWIRWKSGGVWLETLVWTIVYRFWKKLENWKFVKYWQFMQDDKIQISEVFYFLFFIFPHSERGNQVSLY